jgi:rubrerythrin
MATRKPKIKNDKKPKKARAPGKITLQDYKDWSKDLVSHIKELKPDTAMFDKLNAMKARVDKKIAQLEKREREPPKPKDPIKWKCMSCNEIHEKRETVYQCPTCHSGNIERFL